MERQGQVDTGIPESPSQIQGDKTLSAEEEVAVKYLLDELQEQEEAHIEVCLLLLVQCF